MNGNVAVVDLFCGVGGLTCGLKKAGLDVVAGIDNDATCRYAYEEKNFQVQMLIICSEKLILRS